MKNRMVLILAGNEAPELVDAIGGNVRMIEGKMTVPFGLWPLTVKIEGKPVRVLQRLNATTAGAMVAAFNSLRGRFARFVANGLPVFAQHPELDGVTAAAWKRLGKITGLSIAGDALSIECDLPDSTKALLAGNSALAPSPFWGLKATTEAQDGTPIMDPVVLFSVGITPRPNIAGAAANEDPTNAGAATEVAAIVDAAARDRELATASAYIANLESDLASVIGDRDQLKAQVDSLTAALAERDAAIAAGKADLMRLAAELEAAKTATQNAVALAAGNEQAANEARTSGAALVLVAANSIADAAVAGGFVSAADRDFWRDKIKGDPKEIAGLFALARGLKTRTIVDSARIAGANEAAAATPGARFKALVDARMAKTGEKWPDAWQATREANPDLYKLMPNGGKA